MLRETLSKELRANAWFLPVSFLLTALVTQLAFLSPYLMERLVDVSIPGKNVVEVAGVAGLMILVPAVAKAVGSASIVLQMTFNHALESHLQIEVFRRLLQCPLKKHEEISTGDALTRVTSDSSGLIHGLVNLAQTLIQSTLSLATAVYLIWRTSPLMLLGAVIASLSRFPVQMLRAKLSGQATLVRQEWQGQVCGSIVESLGAIRTVKMYTLESDRCDLLRDAIRSAFLKQVSFEKRFQLLSGAETVIGALVPAMVYGFGGVLAIQGRISVGAIIALMQYMVRGIDSITSLTGLRTQIANVRVFAERITGILSLPSEYGQRADSVSSVDEIEVDGISFKYGSSENALLSQIRLILRRGATIGLKGPSGIGKTTLGWLIGGLLTPSEGYIKIDSKMLTDLDIESYRRRVAVVTDSDFVFAAPVRYNLLMVRPSASKDSLAQCLWLSCFDEVVRDLPHGLDTVIGKGGVTLSSGQRQRLSLARAILRDPDVVVLDEFSANLDVVLERRIWDRVFHWLRSRACLVISHRSDTLKRCDGVLVLGSSELVPSSETYTSQEANR